MDKKNPMAIEHYSTKVEFQGRGAGHNHGVLWSNVKKMQFYYKDEKGLLKDIEEFVLNETHKVESVDPEKIVQDIKEALRLKPV